MRRGEKKRDGKIECEDRIGRENWNRELEVRMGKYRETYGEDNGEREKG